MIADIDEAAKTAILELTTIASSSNASSVIKIDIVKPIPAKKPTPRICFHLRSPGKTHKRNATAIKENSKIPSGLPITSPDIIPILFMCDKPCIQSPLSTIHVLASANNGRIKNATGLCKKCCNVYDGDLSSPFEKGITKANKTPVIVA